MIDNRGLRGVPINHVSRINLRRGISHPEEDYDANSFEEDLSRCTNTATSMNSKSTNLSVGGHHLYDPTKYRSKKNSNDL